MKEDITKRFEELFTEGNELIAFVNQISGGTNYYIKHEYGTLATSWLSSVANLVSIISSNNSTIHSSMAQNILNNLHTFPAVPKEKVRAMFGVLDSARKEWNNGLLTKIEYIYAAESFDDFLDHANEYYKAGKVIESSVLASAVLEDTMKKIAIKHSINPKQTLDPLVDEFVKNNICSKITAKKIKASAGVRNSALHANWSDIKINDVEDMIRLVRELISDFLT